jgi:hypothetical protein
MVDLHFVRFLETLTQPIIGADQDDLRYRRCCSSRERTAISAMNDSQRIEESNHGCARTHLAQCRRPAVLGKSLTVVAGFTCSTPTPDSAAGRSSPWSRLTQEPHFGPMPASHCWPLIELNGNTRRIQDRPFLFLCGKRVATASNLHAGTTMAVRAIGVEHVHRFEIGCSFRNETEHSARVRHGCSVTRGGK